MGVASYEGGFDAMNQFVRSNIREALSSVEQHHNARFQDLMQKLREGDGGQYVQNLTPSALHSLHMSPPGSRHGSNSISPASSISDCSSKDCSSMESSSPMTNGNGDTHGSDDDFQSDDSPGSAYHLVPNLLRCCAHPQ